MLATTVVEVVAMVKVQLVAVINAMFAGGCGNGDNY